MTLILAVCGVANFLGKSVIGMLQSAHERRMHADVESFQAIEVASGVEQAVDGLVVAAGRFGKADHGAVGLGHDARGVRGVVHQAGSSAVEARVEFANEGFGTGIGFRGRRIFPFREFFERCGAETIEKLRVDLPDKSNHFANDGARFAGCVGS